MGHLSEDTDGTIGRDYFTTNRPSGNDIYVNGLEGDDLFAVYGNITANGGEGDDYLFGGDDADLYGDEGDDYLFGILGPNGEGVGYLNGGNGNDHIYAGPGGS